MKRMFVIGCLLSFAGAARGDDVAAGKLIYAQHCVVCHGVTGKGDGPSGKALNPRPADFATATGDEAEWIKVTKLGSKAVGKPPGMDGFAGKLTDAQIRDVVAFVRTFKK